MKSQSFLLGILSTLSIYQLNLNGVKAEHSNRLVPGLENSDRLHVSRAILHSAFIAGGPSATHQVPLTYHVPLTPPALSDGYTSRIPVPSGGYGSNGDCFNCLPPPCGPTIVYKDKEKVKLIDGDKKTVTLKREKVVAVPGVNITHEARKEVVDTEEVIETVTKTMRLRKHHIIYEPDEMIVYRDVYKIVERPYDQVVIIEEEVPEVEEIEEVVWLPAEVKRERITLVDEDQLEYEEEEILQKVPEQFPVESVEDVVTIEWEKKMEKIFCDTGRQVRRPCVPSPAYGTGYDSAKCPVCDSCPCGTE